MSKDFGGRMSLRFSNGELIALRATVNLVPTRMTVSAVTNQNGSVDRTGEMKPGTCEISFADYGHNYGQLISGDRFNATLIEEFSGVSHYFTNAFLSGDPSVNRLTGEVTGLTLNYERYNKTDAGA